MLKINSPDAVVVSIAPSVIDLKPMFSPRNHSTSVTRCCIDRPSRSRRQTTSVSLGFKFLRHASGPGLSAFAPDILSLRMSSGCTPNQSVYLQTQILVISAYPSVAKAPVSNSNQLFHGRSL